jgi:hypothetical protein
MIILPGESPFFRNTYFMKTVNLLFVFISLIGACSTPKKTTVKGDSPTISSTDLLIGGTSFSNAVVIMVESERAGLDEEYKWLSINYPGYALIRRSHEKRSSRHYDIIRIKTKQGQVKEIYFDSTRFWGKP